MVARAHLIRRDAWPADVMIYPNFCTGVFHTTAHYPLTPDDIHADDWSICGTLQ